MHVGMAIYYYWYQYIFINRRRIKNERPMALHRRVIELILEERRNNIFKRKNNIFKRGIAQ
tara:strand:- start:8523 stop:8705 length:183 start_codon:yes stop_codon:yes gene_type:complete